MADILLQNALTWVVSNATSIGAILAWVTKPLRDKLKEHEEQIKALQAILKDVPVDLGDRLRQLDRNETQCQDAREEIRRQLDDFLEQLRQVQQDLNQCVSDEEFKGYVAVSNQKIEKVVETLGFIRGRLGSSAPTRE
jgi:chromosome segregation ATPase